MRQVPLWLLDLDGVINGSRPGWSGPPRTTSLAAHGVGYRIRYAPALIQRIRALHNADRVEVRWSTSWVDHCEDLNQLFNLPGVEAAFHLTDATQTQTKAHIGKLKVRAALDAVRAGRRLIWTDDEVIPVQGPDRAELEAGDALLIVPDERRCLRPDDLDVIEAYAQRV
jgi:hypothetical protein